MTSPRKRQRKDAQPPKRSNALTAGAALDLSVNFFSLADEATAWQVHASRAGAAVQFWNSFFNLQFGPQNNLPLTAKAIARILAILRAMSWVESQHGTGAGTSAARDPMQCGNPADAFWRELVDCAVAQDRFIGGPGKPNLDACKLPAAAAADTEFPTQAKLSELGDPKKGHNDSKFGPIMSYNWAVPILVHKMNTKAGAKTYQCGDLSETRLVSGAVAYNGGGDPQYEEKVKRAIVLIGGIPPLREPAFDLTTVHEMSTIARAMVSDVARDIDAPPESRRFLANGVEEFALELRAGEIEVKLRMSGRARYDSETAKPNGDRTRP